MTELLEKERETSELPKLIDKDTIVYWSSSLRELMGVEQGCAIKTKALRFLKQNSVIYDKTIKKFLVHPIKGYNKNTYTVNNRGDNHWQCNCQFYNKVSYKWPHPICSHIQAVKLWLEINRWNRVEVSIQLSIQKGIDIDIDK